MVLMQKQHVYSCWFLLFFFPNTCKVLKGFKKFKSEGAAQGWKLHLVFLFIYTTWVKNLENNTENDEERSLITVKHRVLNENSTDVVLTASSVVPKAGFVHRHFPKALGQPHEQYFPHPLERSLQCLKLPWVSQDLPNTTPAPTLKQAQKLLERFGASAIWSPQTKPNTECITRCKINPLPR